MANAIRPLTTNLPDCGGTTPCATAPACPACGGLQCLCRPRFFAGQLLTEDDLNRLDSYIVAKNRLHNRYLVGTGVACGLEVVCSVCDPTRTKGTVLVRPGYAVSPCGNDIVVCQDQAVDICALIARCRPNTDMCLSATGTADDCGGATEDWILGICYAESASRGVTALLNASDPAHSSCGCAKSGCSCGGGSSGACGCGGTAKQAGGTRARGSAKPAPPQCEPTLTCESYSFVVWKAPTVDGTKATLGAAAKRLACCILPYFTAIGRMPTDATTNWFLNMRETIRDFLIGEGFYDCTIAARLAAVTLGSKPDAVTIQSAGVDLAMIAALFIQKCVCSSLLPPCPDTAPNDCVPIATITVKRRPCEVMKICNISSRKFLITAPNIEYWASFLGLFPAGTRADLRGTLEKMCCTEMARPPLDYERSLATGRAIATQSDQAQALGGASGQLLWEALRDPNRTVNAATLLLGAMGGTDANGKPLASATELANPADFLLLNQVAAPVLRALAPFDPTPASPPSSTGSSVDAQVEQLKKQVADLQRAVKRLKRT